MAKKAAETRPTDPQPAPAPVDINPEPLSSADHVEADEGAGETHAAERGRQSAAPFCPYHPKERCVSRNSNAFFTRYYCPRDDCEFSIKQPRPSLRSRLRREEEQEGFGAR